MERCLRNFVVFLLALVACSGTGVAQASTPYRLTLRDASRGIEEEIREALLNLESAANQVAVAKEGQDLAQRELELSQDRLQSGATNNIEVVTAQDELARAQENYILAVSSYVDAKFALARAVGGTEKNIGQYLEGP